MKTNKLPPIHPGEILRQEFMKPRGLSQNALARALNVPPRRINEIVLEKRGITADTALRLARQTGLGEKTLHRMLHRNGNPTARNLGVIVKRIAEDLGIKPRVEVTANG